MAQWRKRGRLGAELAVRGVSAMRAVSVSAAGAVSMGAVGLVVAASLGGCSGLSKPELCGEIPAGGCPIGRGGTCEDRVCAALYDCVGGDWTEVEACPGGGTTSASTSGAGTGAGGDRSSTSGCVDDEGEGAGAAGGGAPAGACSPELQSPDCPASFATSCDACALGCEDFFACRDGGWEATAHCDEGGQVVTLDE